MSNDIAQLGFQVGDQPLADAVHRLTDFLEATKKADKATDEFNGKAKQTNSVTQMLARGFQSLKTQVIAFGASMVAAFAFGSITSTLVSFEQSMSAVQAVTRSTDEDLASIREVVKDLGATTEFTASQVADGFKFLGLAGFNAAQSIAAMPEVLDLATAATMDLARAADISSNIMAAFGIRAENAAAVTDVLALANANANTTIEQLGDGMKYAGPIAQALGISVGDTAAAIGTLSDAGIQGSMAGTGLRRIMSSLANATPQATKALNAMGLKLEELNPATNDLTDIVGRLAEAGLQADDAFTIFGDRGAPAILALIENNAKLNELTEILGDAGGAASEMARIMRDNLWGDLKNIEASIEAVVIALGESGLTAVLRATMQTITEVFRFLAENMDTIRSMVIGLSILWAGQYVAAVGAAAIATNVLSASLRLLRIAIIGTGIGVLAIVIGEVVSKMYGLSNSVDDVSDSFNSSENEGRSFFETLMVGAELIMTAFDWATSAITMVFLGAFATIRDNFTKLMNLIYDGLSNIPGVDLSEWKGDESAGTAAFLAAQTETETAYARLGSAWRRLIHGDVPMSDIGDDVVTITDMLDFLGRNVQDTEDSFRNLGDTGSDAAKKLAEAYAGITSDARSFIMEQQLEAAALGMTSLQANTLRHTQELLNRAQQAGITLTAAQTQELLTLGAQMAEAEERTRSLTDAYNFGLSQTQNFLQTFRQGMMEGQSIWEAFGNAAISVLDNIAAKLMDMAAQGLWDMLWGGIMGGLTGGLGGSTIVSGVSSFFTPGIGYQPYAEGGYTGNISTSAVAGVVHGQEYVLNAEATRRIGVGTLDALNDNRPVSFGNGGDGNIIHVDFRPVYNINGIGLTMEEVQELLARNNEMVLDELPDRINEVQNDPRKRIVR